jgi:hypothetical protein
MSRQQLIRLVGAFAVALLLWGVLAIVRRPPSDRSERLTFPKVDTGAVDTVAIGTTVVARSGASWRVNGYPTAPEAVTEALKGLADTGASTELVAESKTSHDRLGVGAESGQHVRVIGHGKTVLDLIAGKRTQDVGGVYVRRANEDAVYALRGGIASSVTKSLDDWRDKRIVSIVPESVATVTLQRGAHTLEFRRSVGDTTKLRSLLGSYRDLRATGFADSMSAHPTLRARLVGKSGATLADFVFDSTASGVRARADTGRTIYRLDTWMLGQLLPAK